MRQREREGVQGRWPGVPRRWRLSSGLLIVLTMSVPVGGAESPASQPATAPAPSPAQQIMVLQRLLYGEGDARTRRAAAIKILKLGPEGVKQLAGSLTDENNAPAKLAICEAIAETRSQAAAFEEPLLALTRATDQTDQTLRTAAVHALAAYEKIQIVQVVTRIKAEQERAELRIALIEDNKKLYELTPAKDRAAWLEGRLADPVPARRLTALEIIHKELLQTPPTEPTESLLEQIRLRLADDDAEVLEKAVRVLRDLRQEAHAKKHAPLLRKVLESKQPASVRKEVYNALGWLWDPESIRTCAVGLSDADDEIAAQAAGALGRLAGHNTVPPAELHGLAVKALVERASKSMSDDGLRESVIEAMAKISAPEFLLILENHAGAAEPVPAIRHAAVRGISRLGSAAQVPGLVKILSEDKDARVLVEAAGALGKLGTQAALEPLQSRLSDASEPVQQAAWAAYQAVFQRLGAAEETTAVANFGLGSVQEAGRRAALLTALDKKLVGDDLARARIGEQLGEALLAADQPAEAAEALARVLQLVADGQVDDRTRIAKKMIEAHLASPEPTKAIAAAVGAQVTKDGKTVLQTVRNAVASSLLAHAQETGKRDGPAARTFLEALVKTVPDKFGSTWATQFDAALRAVTPRTQPTTSSSAPAG